MIANVCGAICSEYCLAYGNECRGCTETEGRIPWATFYNLEVCPVYSCVKEKGISHCGECGKAPCDLWQMTLNPNASEAEHAADFQRRLEALAEMKKSV